MRLAILSITRSSSPRLNYTLIRPYTPPPSWQVQSAWLHHTSPVTIPIRRHVYGIASSIHLAFICCCYISQHEPSLEMNSNRNNVNLFSIFSFFLPSSSSLIIYFYSQSLVANAVGNPLRENHRVPTGDSRLMHIEIALTGVTSARYKTEKKIPSRPPRHRVYSRCRNRKRKLISDAQRFDHSLFFFSTTYLRNLSLTIYQTWSPYRILNKLSFCLYF